MDYFAGLDVSVKETSVCIVDDAGKIVREARAASEPEALLQVLTIYRFKRVGLEAGPLSQWLYSVLAEAGLPVICVETRHMRAMLKAQINKTDRNDARGIAQMMRVGLYRPVHVKTLRSQKLRVLLTHRKLLQSKAIAIENDLRATLRNFGLKVGMIGTVKFEMRIRELVENLPDLRDSAFGVSYYYACRPPRAGGSLRAFNLTAAPARPAYVVRFAGKRTRLGDL
jgi:transposase